MGFNKKTAKGRLDKYYFLAKDQGYRARSAFKLVQLNKKYGLLDKARVVVDLCAAPGGWLQVAAKYSPPGHVIVGVDLDAIRPIPGVSTIVADITTERCRAELKRELKGWKADIVLHDGAPNVGKSWLHDAYSQSELVLHSLRLATELLIKDGAFVTKVFRSKDYNSLMWVFNQLFSKVEATKPASSRDVSAEIFVVCRGYRAPDRIDPRLLDPRSVFEEVTSAGGASGAAPGDGMRVNLEHPETRARHRSGYEDGATVLFKAVSVQAFITSAEHNVLLATHNRLVFDAETDPRITALADDGRNRDSIRDLCADLKVLGQREFKLLLKWRLRVRTALGLDVDAAAATPAVDGSVVQTEAVEVPEEDPLEQLDEMTRQIRRAEKKVRAKALERKAKQRLRLQSDSGHAIDLAADEAANTRAHGGLFSLLSRTAGEDSSDNEAKSGAQYSDTNISDAEGEALLSLSESDDGGMDRWGTQVESMLEEQYAIRKGREQRRNPEDFVRAQRLLQSEEIPSDEGSGDSDSDDSESNEARSGAKDAEHAAPAKKARRAADIEGAAPQIEGLTRSLLSRAEEAQEMHAKVDRWYSNPLFGEIEQPAKPQEDAASSDSDVDMAALESSKKKLARMKKQKLREQGKEKKGGRRRDDDGRKPGEIELVPADRPRDDDNDNEDEDSAAALSKGAKDAVLTPQGMTLAARLAADRKRNLKEMIDDSFNRHARDNSEDLPCWFAEEEAPHRRPSRPATKEGMALLRSKQRELDSRPSKKVLEAKGRNRRRAEKHIEALRARAAVIVESEDVSERQKSEQIQRLLAKGGKPARKEKKMVVARGSARGLKGRPKGVKGHYKMVDARLKKDSRAEKRVAVKQKGRGKKAGGKAGGRR